MERTDRRNSSRWLDHGAFDADKRSQVSSTSLKRTTMTGKRVPPGQSSKKVEVAHHVEHAWLYHFVDIIYVGTIFNVSWLIEHCGASIGVFGVSFAYFAIMYSSRLAFDEFYCITQAKGVVHLVSFGLYGAGVFLMAASINADPNEEEHCKCDDTEDLRRLNTADDPPDLPYDYGHCSRRSTYDVGFAVGFMATRLVLIVMYILYFRLYHKSNWVESQEARDLSISAEEEFYRQTENPIRPSFVENIFRIRAIHGARESVYERHFSSIVALKILPAVLNFFVMIGMLDNGNPAVVFPIVAAIEILGWYLPSWLIADEQKWSEITLKREIAVERLGLFFMLVLGEAILHLCRKVDVDKQRVPVDQYIVLLFCFFTVYSMGMQFFEKLQTVKDDAGQHPLDIPLLAPWYVWLVCVISFCMLVAAGGMVGVYSTVLKDEAVYSNVQPADDFDHEPDYPHCIYNIAIGLGTAGILIILLRLMDASYYRAKLLPSPLYEWAQSFYKDPLEPLEGSCMYACGTCTWPCWRTVQPKAQPQTPSQTQSQKQGSAEDSQEHEPEEETEQKTEPEQKRKPERSQSMTSEGSTRTESGKSTSLRRIFWLSLVRIGASVAQFLYMTEPRRNVPPVTYMVYTFLIMSVPNACEVLLELHNFHLDFTFQGVKKERKAAELVVLSTAPSTPTTPRLPSTVGDDQA